MSEELIELGFDDEISDGEGNDIVLFEPGNYQFTVKSYERGKTKESGNNMVTVELEVTDGKKKSTIKDWIVLTNKTMWKIASFFRSIGLKKRGENIKMNWKESVGKSGMCTLSQDEKISKAGNSYKVNSIYSYLDPMEEVEDVEW